MRNLLVLLFVCSMGFGAVACSKSHGNDDPTGGDASTDTDSDTDTDTDTGEEWCPELETSCEAPDALDACGDDTLNEPRLIFPSSGRHIRDRRPRIIWEEAVGATQYRLEIARDRAFTDVVYRSTDYQPFGTDRLEHIVSCDLDCGVHFFRVKSVTSPECETGSSSYIWEMFVGMAPGDLDRDGVPDIMYWKLIEPAEEMQPYLVQGWAFFNLDEKGGQIAEAEKVVEFEVEGASNDLHMGGAALLPDTNMDGFAEMNIAYWNFGIPGDFSTIEICNWVFSGFKNGNINASSDVVSLVQAEVGQLFFLNALHYSNRYSDFNGDGFSDIALSFYDDYGDIGFTGKILIYYGGNSPNQNMTLESADIVIPCPVGCAPTSDVNPTSFGMTPSMADFNSDGFADIATELRDYSSGIADAGVTHTVVVFGDENLPSQVDVLTEGAIVSSTQDSIISGEWDLGNNAGRGTVHSMGDIDFDGYPELGTYLLDAFDTTQSPLVETRGWVVFSDIFGPGQHLLPDVMDTVIVADFETHTDILDTEHVSYRIIPGDMTGNGIDDFILFTSDSGGSNNPGRYFYFEGHEEWDGFIPLSTITDNEIIDPTNCYYNWATDFDGDGIADLFFLGDSLTIWLSASGEDVELNVDYSGAASVTGIVVPEIY